MVEALTNLPAASFEVEAAPAFCCCGTLGSLNGLSGSGGAGSGGVDGAGGYDEGETEELPVSQGGGRKKMPPSESVKPRK